jgi:sRNA-binding protein
MSNRLFVLAVGIGVGYLLGARAGRERYDRIVETVNGVWEDPHITKARADAARYAREHAPVVRDRAKAAAAAAPGVVAATAKDVAAKTTATAKNVAAKTTATAKNAASKVGETRDGLLEDETLDDGEGL